MDSLSLIERMCAYTEATGLPPTGVHRKLTDKVLVKLGVPCITCNGTGLQVLEGRRHFCSACHGFLRCLSAHEVVRLYQIVVARFPELRTRIPLVQEAADRWYWGSAVPEVAPRYFGPEALPGSVPPAPGAVALRVATIVWRNGGHSQFLWTWSADDQVAVLWERLPELLQDDGQAWTEVFAWARGGAADPAQSVRHLLYSGWSVTNPAYEWLGTPRIAELVGVSQFFATTTYSAMVSPGLLRSLFHGAINTRMGMASQPPYSDNAEPVEPYAYRGNPVNPRKLEPLTRLLIYKPKAQTARVVTEARILPFRRRATRLAGAPDIETS